MTRISPPKPVSAIQENGEKLSIVIPVRLPRRTRNGAVALLALSALLVIGALTLFPTGGFTGSPSSIGSPWGVLLPALLAWLAAVALILGLLFKRKQIIRLNAGNLSIRNEIFRLGRSREFDRPEIRNLRYVEPPASPPLPLRSNLLSGETIAFDYGSRTFRFAPGIDEPEARRLIEHLEARL